MLAPTLPRCFRILAVVACLFCASISTYAGDDNTKLVDKTETVEILAPGSWRKDSSDHTIAASGFLGITRARLYVQVYAGTSDADAALAKWKTWRATRGTTKFQLFEDDERRIIASGKLSTQFVRVVGGSGRAAVAWVELKGRAASSEADAFSVLATLNWVKKAPPPSGSGGDKPTPAKPQKRIKDPEFRVEFTLPGELIAIKRSEQTARRFALLEGPIGKDSSARVDLYAFPEFDRADALVVWWKDLERAGWPDPLKFEGDGNAFRVLVQGRTWNRSVQIYPTKAGLYVVKVDADSTVQKDVDRFLKGLETGAIAVLRSRVAKPNPPQGFHAVEHPTHLAFVEGDAGAAEKVLDLVQKAEEHMKSLLSLKPWEGRIGRVDVYRDQPTYDAAVRPLGGTPGSACHWTPALRRVITFAGASATKDSQDALLFVLARDALQRRLGFPPPFWLDHGYGLLVAGSAHTKGRTNVATPVWVEGVRNAAAGTVDFEATRFWGTKKSRTNRERLAVVWGFAFLFHEGSAISKKWSAERVTYMKTLRRTADPVEAGKAFSFTRQAELAEDFKKRMRKL